MRASARTKRLVGFSVAVAGFAAVALVGHQGGAPARSAGSVLAQTGSEPLAKAARSGTQEFAAGNVCVGCHSPTNGPALSGMLTGRWLSPNITPDRVSGIGAWSRDDLFR